jgi:hypothetical protein
MAPEIIERVREFQRLAAEQAGETVEKVTREINEIVAEARADKAHNAAISGVGLKSKLLGLVVDRQEVKQVGDLSQANSTAEIVDGLIRRAELEPDDQLRQQVRAELHRNADALDAIFAAHRSQSMLANAASDSPVSRH